MKKILFLGCFFATSTCIKAELTRASILQTAIVPYLQAEDSAYQLQSTQEVIIETETAIETTQEELINQNSIIDEADPLISGTSIPDASLLDTMISKLFEYDQNTYAYPTDSLVQNINDNLLPYLQASLAKMTAIGIIKHIAVGTTHTLILLNNGTIYGCGSNTHGQLGLGNDLTDQRTLTPMLAPTEGWQGKPTSLAAGDSFSIILTTNGNIYSCGSNAYGQLGIGNDLTDQPTLTLMHAPIEGFNGLPKLLTTGQNHTLVLTNNGTIYGCGNNNDGQLGLGSSGDIHTTLTPMDLSHVDGTPSTLAAKSNHSMVLMSNGKIYGCGMNTDGPLGIGTTDSPQTTLTPMDLTVLGLATPTTLAAGDGHTLVLASNGTLYGCGWNTEGQLGIGSDFTNQLTLTLVHAPLIGWRGTPTTLAAGSQYSLILTSSSMVYGCGNNSSGQLGLGNTLNQATLTAMNRDPLGYALPSGFTAGLATTLILATDGKIYGCGDNAQAQLGIGNDLSNQTTLTGMHTLRKLSRGPVRITVQN